MTVLIKESPRFLGTDKKMVRKITENLKNIFKATGQDLSILFVNNKKIGN